jgi:hypothetical protein
VALVLQTYLQTENAFRAGGNMLQFNTYFYFTLTYILLISLGAEAQSISKVIGNEFKIENNFDHIKLNQKYFVEDANRNKKAIVLISAVDELEGASGKVLKGKVQPGWNLVTARNPSSVSQAKLESKNMKNNLSVFGLAFTGSGSSGSSSTEINGVNVETGSSSSSAQGFSLGAGYEFWMQDFAVGAEYRFSSVSFSNGGSGSTNDIGATAGLLLPELKLKLTAAYYLMGSASVGSASASAGSGFKLGAQYKITNQIGIIGEYRNMDYATASVNGLSTSAAAFSINSFNVGVGFGF